jgi:branched-chain amino acid aminotransferase
MSSINSAFRLYGKGVFTTISISDGQPFLWEKHWRRLTENTAKLGIDISQFSEAATLNSLKPKLADLSEGRARIAFLDGSTSSIWPSEGGGKTELQIIVGEPRIIPEHFKLTISPHRVNTTSPLTGIKSCNYLDHLLAHEEAASRGFDEAVRVNERGEITSGCMSNIFWRSGGKLFTPSLATGCLAGTTREHILETVECEEIETSIEVLKKAEQIFLTSAGLGMVAVVDHDGRALASEPVLTAI